MAKKYLHLGIDHGTSNSVIAVMEAGQPRVVKVNMVDEIMPSVIYIDKKGRTVVGAAAYRAMMKNEPSEGNGYSGYKLRIGQDDTYNFSVAGKNLSAQEMGGLVIGSLLRAYQEEEGSDMPVGAVVTVPAKFEHSACDGTREAAKSAGLQFYPLLQEPIAAALGYGFSANNDQASYMVFDLGGGTFDVSLVFIKDGEMFVPEEGHAGDSRLGGRKFDREIMSFVLEELKKEYTLDKFTESNKKYQSVWGNLSIACEQAKIQLSSREQAIVEIDGVLCQDDKGRNVKVEVPIIREQYEELIKTDIDKTIHICKTLLEKNNMRPQDLERLLLVGGPSKTPYIQKALTDAIGVEVDTSVDPMIAVACGAAIYASTQEIPKEFVGNDESSSKNTITVNLEYERVSKLNSCFVAGKVEGADMNAGELRVEILRSDGRWSSSMLPVNQDGCFETDLALIDEGKPCMSKFTTRLLDSSGRIIASIDEPEIWFRYPEGKARLANSLRVAVAGNDTEVLIKPGASLPAEGWERFLTQKPLRQGSGEDVLNIPVVEGVSHLFGDEDDHADCNAHMGTLTIHGDDERVKFDLPEDAEIEVTIRQDSSRQVRCVAYIPLLEEEFEATINRESFNIELKPLEERFNSLKETLNAAEKLNKQVPISGLDTKIETLRSLQIVEEIDKELERANEGETESFHRAYRRILELAGAVNQIREKQCQARITKRISELEKVVEGSDCQSLEEIRSEFEEARDDNDDNALIRIEESLDQMDINVRCKPYYDLLIDLMAVNNHGDTRANSEQLNALEKASDVFSKVEEKGGMENLNDTDLKRMASAHDKLMQMIPELGAWRLEVINDLPPGQSPADLGKDLKKA